MTTPPTRGNADEGEPSDAPPGRNGAQDGPDRRWWPNGRLRAESRVESGRIVGVARLWHENGQIAEERYHAASGELLAVVRRDADGTPDPANPVVVDTDDTDWDISLAVTYEDEWFTGHVVEYDRDGRIVGFEGYRNGWHAGSSRRWWPNGTLRSRFEATDFGRIVGDAFLWHPNGQLAARLVHDERGTLLTRSEWDENGRPVERRPRGSRPAGGSDGARGEQQRR